MELDFSKKVKSYHDFLSNMFILGFTLERKDDKGELIYRNKYENPIKNIYKDLWIEEIWHQARRGTPNDYPVDGEYEDYFPLEGILFMLKQINNITLLGLPEWTIFYILGEGLGRFNSNKIKQSEFEYFISKLPIFFIHKYSKLINSPLLPPVCNWWFEGQLKKIIK